MRFDELPTETRQRIRRCCTRRGLRLIYDERWQDHRPSYLSFTGGVTGWATDETGQEVLLLITKGTTSRITTGNPDDWWRAGCSERLIDPRRPRRKRDRYSPAHTTPPES